MSGHFDDEASPPARGDSCAYCRVLRDEPCSQFISRACAADRCQNLCAVPTPSEAPRQLIQIGPLDV